MKRYLCCHGPITAMSMVVDASKMTALKPSSDSTVTVRFGTRPTINEEAKFDHATATNTDDNAASSSLQPPRFAVAYWSMRGLGAPLRMMLCATQTDFVSHMYDSVENNDSNDNATTVPFTSSYFADKERFINEHGQHFMNLPFIIDEQEQVVVTQTNACFQYLGEQLGLMGQSLSERTLCVQLLCEVYDLRHVMVSFCYRGGGDGNNTAEKAAQTVQTAQEHFVKFNQHFQAKLLATTTAADITTDEQTRLFSVGHSFTAPDFHLFEMIDQFDELCRAFQLADCLQAFPHVRTFYTSFAKLEENQFYLTSMFYTSLPINNPYATAFGSALPHGTTYRRNETATPWRKQGSITLWGPPIQQSKKSKVQQRD